ncbi:MAG TPA: DNA starvation/stationary phase protection protein, partial [Pseudomonadaceae bacterium]|nr:DNA starvation/stationary phase protection protein [Pseudomonadaceae bacterium]
KPAQDAADESTVSLVSDRMVLHEKTAWMLRSLL